MFSFGVLVLHLSFWNSPPLMFLIICIILHFSDISQKAKIEEETLGTVGLSERTKESLSTQQKGGDLLPFTFIYSLSFSLRFKVDYRM